MNPIFPSGIRKDLLEPPRVATRGFLLYAQHGR